jgi:hypothetical protein
LLVLPSDTLPKVTAEGLALSALEGTELAVAEAELIAAELEAVFALVTPVQPERITPHIKSVRVRKRINPGRLGYLCESVESDRERVVLGCVSMTLRV